VPTPPPAERIEKNFKFKQETRQEGITQFIQSDNFKGNVKAKFKGSVSLDSVPTENIDV
jgi:hypothetical protein